MRSIFLSACVLIPMSAIPAAAGCAGGDGYFDSPISSEHLLDGTRWTALLKAMDHYGVPRDDPGNAAYRSYEEVPAWKAAGDSVRAALRRNGLDSIADRQWGGFICNESGPRISNHAGTVWEFLQALSAEPSGRKHFRELALMRSRIHLDLGCRPDRNLPAVLPDLRRLAAHPEMADWGRYLYASAIFYADSLAETMRAAGLLMTSRIGWVAEAAWILRARAAMIAAQKDWDGWSDPAGKVDKEMLALSAREYAGYLTRYPGGRFRHSAHSMRRRIHFLAGNRSGFNRAVVEDFESCLRAGAGKGCPILPIALDARFHYDDSLGLPESSPLLMVHFVRSGREHDWGKVLERLERDGAAYAAYPGLRDYITAAVLLRKGDHEGVAARFGNLPPPRDPPARGIALAVGRALENRKQWKAAAAHWTLLAKTVPDGNLYIQKHLANAYLQAGDAPGALDTSSMVSDTAALIEAAYWSGEDSCVLSWAGRPGLKAVARHALVRRVLSRHLYSGRYREFEAYYDSLGPELRVYHDSAISAVRLLARNPRDPAGLFGLGNFLLRIMDLRWDAYQLEARRFFPDIYDLPRGFEPDRPCCRGQGGRDGYTYVSERAARPTPFSLFLRALREIPEKESHGEEARLLRHLILCYSQTSLGYACEADKDLPLEERRKWFKRLHRKYPDTEWARKTANYY